MEDLSLLWPGAISPKYEKGGLARGSPLGYRTISKSDQQGAASPQGAHLACQALVAGGVDIISSASVGLGLDSAIWLRKEEKKREMCAL